MLKICRGRSKFYLVLVLALLCSLVLALPALAGEGDGSGGGKGVPLGLDSSTPSNGQQGVALQPEIKLTFNKNVIYLAIRENNKKCFALYSAQGSQIPIEVIMADDQIEFEKRRDISLKPLQELEPGTAYVVKISPQLQAKNGMSLDKQVAVNFVTAGTAPKPVQPVTDTDKDTGKKPVNNIRPEPAVTETKTPVVGESTHPVSETDKQAETTEKQAAAKVKQSADKPSAAEQKKPNLAVPVTVGVVLAAALAYAFYKRRT